eukprot:GHVN01083262.1.p2 GENE.GHVN01083262.1~~GHVN01083262.1.p2  ORF type:complete len:201 (-),score=29.80 GHVN01083262.1:4078-4680(-)
MWFGRILACGALLVCVDVRAHRFLRQEIGSDKVTSNPKTTSVEPLKRIPFNTGLVISALSAKKEEPPQKKSKSQKNHKKHKEPSEGSRPKEGAPKHSDADETKKQPKPETDKPTEKTTEKPIGNPTEELTETAGESPKPSPTSSLNSMSELAHTLFHPNSLIHEEMTNLQGKLLTLSAMAEQVPSQCKRNCFEFIIGALT